MEKELELSFETISSSFVYLMARSGSRRPTLSAASIIGVSFFSMADMSTETIRRNSGIDLSGDGLTEIYRGQEGRQGFRPSSILWN